MQRMITLDPDDPLEATTAMLAALASPEALPDHERFDQAHCTLMGYMYRVIAVAVPDWERTRQHIKPGFLILERPTVNRLIRLTTARLRQGLTVARISRPFLADVTVPNPPLLPRGVLSIFAESGSPVRTRR